MPTLNNLLSHARTLGSDPVVTGLTADSRAVQPGFVFAALPGSKVDGTAFIADAIAKGAVAILAPQGTTLPAGAQNAVLITDAEPRRLFALMAARFYGAQPAQMVAVTGTNGKTSIANFVRQIWAGLGLSAASFGTIGLISPKRVEKGSLTTPDPVTLHQTLAELAADGVTHAAFEASSHGLDQFRLDGVAIKAAGFTNLTRDHLDYHASMDAYFQAKSRLFSDILPADGVAVINADADRADDLAALCRARGVRVIAYGRDSQRLNGEEIRIIEAKPAAHGQDLTLSVLGTVRQLHLPLAGAFQAYNAACALGLVIALGADPKAAADQLEHLEGVPGRLQPVGVKSNGAAIYVDYAHTPDALETVLKALRPHVTGKLVAVFGCGGDRDPGKRPQMGEIAARLADVAIVTDDNPRSEDPALIRAQIMAACKGGIEIGDRHQAIRQAVRDLTAGDVLVLAGKGHETGQIVKGEVLPFDDAEEARAALKVTP